MLGSVSEFELNRALTTWYNLQKKKQSNEIVALARDVYLSLSEAQMARTLNVANMFANRAYASQKKLNKLLEEKSPSWFARLFVL
jgi:hypothetical protein